MRPLRISFGIAALSVGLAIGSNAAPQIGDPAPAFTLTGLDGKEYTLSDQKGKIVVLEWIYFGCPFVKKHYGSGHMQKLQERYGSKNVVWFSVASGKTADAGELKAHPFAGQSMATAILLDPNGSLGKAIGARTTPQVFVIDAEGNLAYNGAVDDRRTTDPADAAQANNYIAAALDALLAGKPVETPVSKPYGCAVKY